MPRLRIGAICAATSLAALCGCGGGDVAVIRQSGSAIAGAVTPTTPSTVSSTVSSGSGSGGTNVATTASPTEAAVAQGCSTGLRCAP